MYRSGTIEIEDRSSAAGSDKQQRLIRVLQFNSPTPQSVWFRALTGEVTAESDRVFKTGRLRLTVPAVEVKLRPLPDNAASFELLLKLELPQGKSTQEILYQPLEQ